MIYKHRRRFADNTNVKRSPRKCVTVAGSLHTSTPATAVTDSRAQVDKDPTESRIQQQAYSRSTNGRPT